jgi:hypothetical protein
VAVAEKEVRPRLHAKEHLPQYGQVVHVVGVNSDLGAAARHNQVFRNILFGLDPDEDAPFAFDLFRINEVPAGLELALSDEGAHDVDLAFEESTGHGRQDEFGICELLR